MNAQPGAVVGQPALASAKRPHGRARLQLLLLPATIAALLILVWVAALQHIAKQATAASRHAATEADAWAERLTERTGRILQRIDQASHIVAREVSQGRPVDLNELVRSGAIGVDGSLLITLADPAGRLVASTQPFTKPITVSDREEFCIHLESGADRLYIGKPLLSRVLDRPVLQMSRRLTLPDGRLGGVVGFGLDPAALTERFLPAALGPNAIAAIVDHNGVVLSARRGSAALADKSIDAAALERLGISGTAHLEARVGPLDQMMRFTRVLPLADLPVWAVVSVAQDDALAAADAHAITVRLRSSVASAVLLLLGALLVRQMNRIERARADYAAAIGTSLDGFFLLDAVRNPHGEISDFIVKDVNERGAALFRRPRQALIGQRLTVLLPSAAPSGFLGDCIAVARTGTPLEQEFRVPEPQLAARWIRHLVLPVPRGIAISSRDVTQAKEAEIETRRGRALLHAILDHLPIGVSAKSAREQDFGTFLFNNAASRHLFGALPGGELGRTLHDLQPAAIADRMTVISREVVQTRALVHLQELALETAAGLRWVNITKVPVASADGTVDRVVTLAEDVTQRKADEDRLRAAQAELQRMALHDALTGLPNRAAFQAHLEQSVQRAAAANDAFAILFIDLDNFKTVNDTLGHEAGDELLREVAARLTQAVRKSDVVCRLGGDEFTVVVDPLGHPDDVTVVCEHIAQALHRPATIAGRRVQVSGSIGVCVYPRDGGDVSALLRGADLAMYQVKAVGKNGYAFYQSDMVRAASIRLTIEQELREAIAAGELRLVYQPKRRLADNALEGFEALVRWHHPQRGEVMPGEFIPVAEQTDLIVELGDWVIRAACGQVRQWRDAGYETVPVAVNVAARQLQRGDLIGTIAAALHEAGLEPAALQLELTESAMLTDPMRARAILSELEALGVVVAIDDFGTGEASLARLIEMPVTTLKIDRSLLLAAERGTDGLVLFEGTAALVRRLGFRTVVEGIESEAQLALATRCGCDAGQGYHLGRPVPAAVAEAGLRLGLPAAAQSRQPGVIVV